MAIDDSLAGRTVLVTVRGIYQRYSLEMAELPHGAQNMYFGPAQPFWAVEASARRKDLDTRLQGPMHWITTLLTSLRRSPNHVHWNATRTACRR